MLNRLLHLLILALLGATGINAQIFNPVKWKSSIVMTGDKTGEIVLTATIDRGWHMYSNDVDPDAGPTPLSTIRRIHVML